ncbi:MAG: tetratricopeptide repeat-containing sensor histidine kinase [Anaerolineae bacterium]
MADTNPLKVNLLDSTYIKVKIAALNNLAWSLRNQDEKRSQTLSDAAYTLACQQLPDGAIQEQMAYSLTTLAYINHYYKADFELALSQALEAAALFEQAGRVKGLPPALNIAGLSYVRLGDPSEAMEYHLRALKICEAFGDRINEAEVYNHLAIVHIYWGEHQQALEYFGKSLALHQEVGNQFGQALTLLNRCMTFKDLGEYQDALISGLQSLHLLEQLEGTWWPIPMALANIANVYLELGQIEHAFDYFEQSLVLVNQVEDKFTQVYVLLNAARAYYKRTDYKATRQLLYRGLVIAEESKQKGFQFECHQMLASLFKAEGNFEKALAHYEKFHELNREVFNEQSDRRLKNLLVRHRTELVQQEAQVYQLKNVELEHEILERHKIEAELQKINAQLTELNANKDRLFSIIAHDLRSPFAPLLSLAQLLAESAEALAPLQIKEVGQSILTSAHKVYDLLETLLDWSRIQQGRLEYRPASLKLDRIVERNIQLFAPTAQAKNITLQPHVAEDILVWADQYMLDTVIRNLLSNALKFTSCGGTVTIKAELNGAHSDSSPGDLVKVSISDTGVGISPLDLPRLFKIEENYHTQGTAQEKGTGLGLLICKEMVERNKGQLTVTSQVGAGTTFTFTVPRSSP